MSFQDTLDEIGFDEKKLIELAYIQQGSGGAEIKDWNDMSDAEKGSYLNMYQYIKSELAVPIEDTDGKIVAHVKEAKNSNHGYMGLVFMNPGDDSNMFIEHIFSDKVDYDEFMYFWEDYGKQLSEKIYGKKLLKSTKKFETGDKQDDEFAGLTKINWDKFDIMKTLPDFTKHPDTKQYHTQQVMAMDNFGNCEVGVFVKSGKKSKRVQWVTKEAMQKPMYWISQYKLIDEVNRKKLELSK